MPKCVWIFNHYAIEPGEPGGTRHFDLASGLVEHDWNAIIIASSVVHVSGRQRLSENEPYRIEYYDKIPFVWLKTPSYHGNGGGRLFNMLAYTIKAIFSGYSSFLPKPDVVIGSSVHPLAAIAGALLAKKHSVPFIFEVRDLWPQTLIDMGRVREKSLIVKVLRFIELWLYKRASKIITLGPTASDYIVPLGIPEGKIVWIPNGAVIYPMHTTDEAKEGSEPFTLMYFGAHGQANGLDTILHAMKLVSDKYSSAQIKLRLIGDGPLKQDLVALADTLGLENVSFEPAVPKNMIPSLASEADAFVISVLNLPGLYRFGISMNKIFDYFAAAKPVVIAVDASNNPIDEAGAGITVAPDSPEAFAKAILELYNMAKPVRAKMGLAGRDYVEKNHSFEVLSTRLAKTLNEVA